MQDMYPISDLDNYKLQVELLQEKLQNSEKSRQQLEHKLEKILQKRRENDRSAHAKACHKYQAFLDEQQRRSERNKVLLQMLERIDEQSAHLSARSERLKMLKLQYEMYFAKLVQSQTMRCIQSSTQSTSNLPSIPVLVPTTSVSSAASAAVMTCDATTETSFQPANVLGNSTPSNSCLDINTHYSSSGYSDALATALSAPQQQHWALALATPTPAGLLLANQPTKQLHQTRYPSDNLPAALQRLTTFESQAMATNHMWSPQGHKGPFQATTFDVGYVGDLSTTNRSATTQIDFSKAAEERSAATTSVATTAAASSSYKAPTKPLEHAEYLSHASPTMTPPKVDKLALENGKSKSPQPLERAVAASTDATRSPMLSNHNEADAPNLGKHLDVSDDGKSIGQNICTAQEATNVESIADRLAWQPQQIDEATTSKTMLRDHAPAAAETNAGTDEAQQWSNFSAVEDNTHRTPLTSDANVWEANNNDSTFDGTVNSAVAQQQDIISLNVDKDATAERQQIPQSEIRQLAMAMPTETNTNLALDGAASEAKEESETQVLLPTAQPAEPAADNGFIENGSNGQQPAVDVSGYAIPDTSTYANHQQEPLTQQDGSMHYAGDQMLPLHDGVNYGNVASTELEQEAAAGTHANAADIYESAPQAQEQYQAYEVDATSAEQPQQQQYVTDLDYQQHYDASTYEGVYDFSGYPGYAYDESTGQYTMDEQQTYGDTQQYTPAEYTASYEQATPVYSQEQQSQSQNQSVVEKQVTVEEAAAAAATATPASVKPTSILAAANEARQQQKKKKRVNFVDSSETDDSGSLKPSSAQGAMAGERKMVENAGDAAGSNESDFDFSSSTEAANN